MIWINPSSLYELRKICSGTIKRDHTISDPKNCVSRGVTYRNQSRALFMTWPGLSYKTKISPRIIHNKVYTVKDGHLTPSWEKIRSPLVADLIHRVRGTR